MNLRKRLASNHPVTVFKAKAEQNDWGCDVCGWKSPKDLRSVLNVHHIQPRCAGGKEHEDNYALLCPTCHALAHAIGTYVKEGRKNVGWVGPRNRYTLIDALKPFAPQLAKKERRPSLKASLRIEEKHEVTNAK